VSKQTGPIKIESKALANHARIFKLASAESQGLGFLPQSTKSIFRRIMRTVMFGILLTEFRNGFR